MFLFVVFYNVVLFGMAIIDEGDFDLFVDCYNLKRHGVYSALNWSFLVWGVRVMKLLCKIWKIR